VNDEPGDVVNVPMASPPDRSTFERRLSMSRRLLEWLAILLVALLGAFAVRAYVFQTFYIPSGSMEPTLHVGDSIVVSKLSVEWGTIHTGDVLVFRRPARLNCGGESVAYLVKRVIGLPGQRLYSQGNIIYVNGHALKQNWTHNEPIGPVAVGNGRTDPVVVPANSYFMMGDNEANSCDSRYWGAVGRNLVVGKVVARIWPPSRIGFL
jgi:signal peptidase I